MRFRKPASTAALFGWGRFYNHDRPATRTRIHLHDPGPGIDPSLAHAAHAGASHGTIFVHGATASVVRVAADPTGGRTDIVRARVRVVTICRRVTATLHVLHDADVDASVAPLPRADVCIGTVAIIETTPFP